jgi:uncharacterized phage protein (TIGR02220 family)
MSRYRKIDCRMYGDEKFRRLRPLAPGGAALWIYLLTGPHTTPVPGLSAIGRLALSEALGWTLEEFDDAFAELAAQLMVRCDWRARVLWIPRAILYNAPQSPNVVLSWAAVLSEIPECKLKEDALRELETFCEAEGPAFGHAFARIAGHKMHALDPDSDGTLVPVTDRESEVALRVITHLNEVAGTRFSHKSKATQRLISARLREHHSEDDLLAVIDRKCADWIADAKMRAYLRPETLFNATKFESYLNGHAGSGVTNDLTTRNRDALRRALGEGGA